MLKRCKCKNPNHTLHVVNFIEKYPTAKGGVPQTIIMVDPSDWSAALENPTLQHYRGYSTSQEGDRNDWLRTSMPLSVGGSILTSLIVSMPED